MIDVREQSASICRPDTNGAEIRFEMPQVTATSSVDDTALRKSRAGFAWASAMLFSIASIRNSDGVAGSKHDDNLQLFRIAGWVDSLRAIAPGSGG
jgi:hypothetical protein